jgi:diguanylate cyclase
MQDKPTKSDQQSPADIAREAFRRLAARRISPTPDAYREIYDEVAGIREPLPAEKILGDFAINLTKGPGELSALSRRLVDSLKVRDWGSCGKYLHQLVEKHLAPSEAALSAAAARKAGVESPAAKSSLIPLVDAIATPAKRESIPLVDEVAPAIDRGPISLVDAVDLPTRSDAEPVPGTPSQQFNDTQLTRMLREMLVRILTLAVPALLQDAKELTQESESLASAINSARSRQSLADIEPHFKQFCFKVEMKSGDVAEERELLLRLFQMLIENVGELVEDDSWLSGQIANVQETLSGRITYATLLDATRSLKEVIYKQSLLKHSLAEAKARVKDMMLTVIDRLGTVAINTGDYHKKIENYSLKISNAKGIGDLNQVLDDMLLDTRAAQEDALRSQHDMITARREVEAADARIHELEAQLTELSELAHEDQLTGSLNRRGLDEVLEREMARAERTRSPLCVALLDLDDFKKLNDTHGHIAGDGALIHLVRVVKNTLRTMDVIARFGGEEFMFVLPNTSLDDAMQTVTRVQRELTKQIFMHDNQRLLITFSAGVALYKSGEEQPALIARADAATYRAKRAGKNRVVVAE